MKFSYSQMTQATQYDVTRATAKKMIIIDKKSQLNDEWEVELHMSCQ